MQVTETNAEGLRREFRIVIPAGDFQAKFERRLQEVGRTVRLPGFRPGKVPLSLLKQRYGSSLMGEIVESTVSDSSSQVMNERGLRPAGEPKIEIVSFAEGKDLEYSMAVELIPDIVPMDFAKLELERLTVDVDEAEVDRALQRLAEQYRGTSPVAEPRPAEKGDILVIDFAGRIGGEPFPGGSATGHHVALGSGFSIPGFEEQLVGARVGDHIDVTVTFPADYPNEALAGKEAVFAVDVREHKVPDPVAVDEDLAKKLGAESLDALRQSVRRRIEADYGAISRARLKRQLLDVLAAEHSFVLPAAMVEAEFEAIWRQIEADREKGRLDPEDEGKSEEVLRQEYREIAERRVKLGLLLSEVGRLNNIQVTREELGEAVVREAGRYPGQERKVLDFYQKNPQALAQLRAPLYEDKVVDFILEIAQPRERKVTPDELTAIPPAPSDARAGSGDS